MSKAAKGVSDSINHPAHYTSSPAACPSCGQTIECITITEHMNFNLGNCLKYLWRAGKKGDRLEDLRKAAWYVSREIAREQRARRSKRTGGDAK